MKDKKNYLDYIPAKNLGYKWEYTKEGNVIVYRENKRVFERLTQLAFKMPVVTRIELEEFGTFIWQMIDGNRTVYDIAQLVNEQFGEEAEPLYERIVGYFRSMYAQRLVSMRQAQNEQ